VSQITKSAWLLILLSAVLQILIFPLPNLYMLSWLAITPLLIAILHARRPSTLQLDAATKLLPASPLQAFLLAYVCGILWYAGTCYWIFSVMHQYGGVNTPAALGLLLLFCLYLALYHGAFGLLVSLLTTNSVVPTALHSRSQKQLATAASLSPRALLLSPVVWVAVELARTRITGFPWGLLGTTQVDNIPLARIASVTGVYGLSFEIMLVNAALAAAFLIPRDKRKQLFLATIIAAAILQSGSLFPAPTIPTDHNALLVQANVPILEGADWTKTYFDQTLRDLTQISLNTPQHPDLIVWPESPAPFYANDPLFRDAISNLATQSNTWLLTGSIGIRNATATPAQPTEVYNSASLVNPSGQWVSRYDKIHLVPFGEYVPFKSIFSFAGGLTKEVGDFSRGTSRAPLNAGDARLGTFICYESIFPDDIRRFANNGAQVLVNISNDGWYGDSGAYAQHLKQSRMRAVENHRWLLLDTNTGLTAAIDPNGQIIASAPRKTRTALQAPYALSNSTTFYTRHGDWFAYACAIISAAALLMRFTLNRKI
jgi:apolipoprotein N-acyltransferase